MTKASDNDFPSILIQEGSAPTSPGATTQRLFIDSADHLVKVKNSGGTVTPVGAAGGVEFTDGMHDVTGATKLTVTGATVGGTTPNATLTVTGGSAGALVLLEQHTAATSARLDFTTAITSAYDEYLIELVNVLPATDTNNLYMRCSTNGGSTYDSSSIYTYAGRYSSTGGNGDTSGGSQSAFLMAGSNVGNVSTNIGVCGTIHLYNPLSSAFNKAITYTNVYFHNSIGNILSIAGAGQYASMTAVNALCFYFGSGNIASGTIRVYGIAKS